MKRNRIGFDVLFTEIKTREKKKKNSEKCYLFNVPKLYNNINLYSEGSNANGIE